MNAHWGAMAPAVMQQYPLSRFNGEAVTAFVRADADAMVVCPSWQQAKWAAGGTFTAGADTTTDVGAGGASGGGEGSAVRSFAYLFDYSKARIRPCDICADIDDDMHNPIAPGKNCTM